MLRKLTFNEFWIFLFLFGVVVLDNGSTPMKIIKLVFVSIAAIKVIRKGKLHINSYIKWLFIFSVFACVSVVWSSYKDISLDMASTIVLNFLCVFSYILLHDYGTYNFGRELQWLCIFPLLEFVRILITYGSAVFSGIRNLDAASSLHNSIAMYSSCAIIILFVKRDWKSLQRVILIALNLLVVIFSGSRKAIAYIAIGLIVYALIVSKNPLKVLRNVLVVAILGVAVYFIIMNNSFFYEYVGSGLETLMAGVFGNSDLADASTSARMRIIQYGMEEFKHKPLFGYGLDSFKMLHQATYGQQYIADNNYVELLVDLGITGLIIFYIEPVRLLAQSIFMCRKKLSLNRFCEVSVCLISSILFGDMGLVTFRNLYALTLYSLIYLLLKSEITTIRTEN